MIRKLVYSFIISFIVFSFLFLSMPNKALAQPGTLGCCVDDNDVCIGCGELQSCSIPESVCGDINGVFMEDQTCFEEASNGCGGPGTFGGCCVLPSAGCQDDIDISECQGEEGVAWYIGVGCGDVPECQAEVARNVPSLSQWGLIAMAGLLGIVGLIIVRRRSVTA